ncbi:hypothetical protein FRC17_007909, partial [Serendipita sp. 399]
MNTKRKSPPKFPEPDLSHAAVDDLTNKMGNINFGPPPGPPPGWSGGFYAPLSELVKHDPYLSINRKQDDKALPPLPPAEWNISPVKPISHGPPMPQPMPFQPSRSDSLLTIGKSNRRVSSPLPPSSPIESASDYPSGSKTPRPARRRSGSEEGDVQCSGTTKQGKRCTRKVKTAPPLVVNLDPESAAEEDERYCFQHAKEILSQKGFFPKPQAAMVDFDTWISLELQEDTKVALRAEMAKPVSAADTPGYIYCYQIINADTPDHVHFKVGRSVNFISRVNQWEKQCRSKSLILRGCWPTLDEQTPLKGKMVAPEKGPYVNRLEKLIHLELADIAKNALNNTLELHSVPPPALPGQQPDVWSLYNSKAKPVDSKFIRIWVNGLNGIMIFAALFAGVISTLLVDTKQLLQPEPEDITHNLLYFLAKQTTNHTDTLPTNLDPAAASSDFKPPTWAVLVNVCFLASLTFSVLAALGAIVCLEWVLEYDEPPESAPSIRQQALRRHFRFQSMKTWYMGRLIITLPLMLYWIVVIFFCGLTIWAWHTYPYLATLPLLGIILTLGGSLFTNLAAILSPCVPFQTVMTKGTFRAFVSAHISIWYVIEVAPILFERWWNYLSTLFQEDGPASRSRVEQKLRKSRVERTKKWKEKVQDKYPWMPEERPFQIGVHADRREEHTIKTSITLKLSALSWLANFIELCPTSAPAFASILQEMNQLEENEMQLWGSLDFEAPWGAIFRIVVDNCRDPASRSNTNMILWRTVVAELQAKMINNPQVFSRIVPSILELDDLRQFLQQLRVTIDTSPPPCGRVIEGIFTLLSHPDLDRKNHLICFEILSFVLQYLDIQKGNVDRHLTVAWVFALCATRPCQLEALQWDNIFDESLSFKSMECSSAAIRGYIQLMDDYIHRPHDPVELQRHGVYSNNEYIAVALLTDFLVPEYRHHHGDIALDDIPAPQHWALKPVHSKLTSTPSDPPKLLDDSVVYDICENMKAAKTSIIAAKVIQSVAPLLTLFQWVNVFSAMDELSPSGLEEIYKPVLLAFTNANLSLPKKQPGILRRAVQKLSTSLRIISDQRDTSTMEVPKVPLTPRTRRTESYTQWGSIVPLSEESQFFFSLAGILRKIASQCPDSIPNCTEVIQRVVTASWEEGWTLNAGDVSSIDALEEIVNQRRVQLQPDVSPNLEIILDSITRLRQRATHRSRAATAELDSRSIAPSNA